MKIPFETVTKLSNFSELLDFCNTTYGVKTAFETPDEKVNFAEFRATVLANLEGIKETYKNRRIALIGENSLDWIYLFFVIAKSGNTVIIIDKDETEKNMETMLKTANAEAIFVSKKYEEKVKKLKTGGVIFKKNKIAIKTFDKVLDKTKKSDGELPETNENEPHIVFFTSGTSGDSKAVELTEKSVVTDIYAASSLFRPYGKTVAFLPFHHAFGLVTGILKPFYYGAPIYISPSLKTVAKDIKNFSPQTIFAVPAVVELFYRQIWREAKKTKQLKKMKVGLGISGIVSKHHLRNKNQIRSMVPDGSLDLVPLKQFRDLKSTKIRRKLFKTILDGLGGELEVIICGGAYLDQKYIDFFEKIGIQILNGYGITECSPVVSVNRPALTKRGSVGQICRDIEVKIAEDDEILIKSDTVMKWYYKNPRETKKAFTKDGYFRTGDLGYLDKDNFLFITGRKKDLIILSNGENISPESIEKEFLHEESVRECVVSVESGQLIAEIFPTEEYIKDQEFFDNMLYNYNKGRARNHQVALIRLREEEFPKNNNTKILRRRLK